jgi:hypothetical protein
MKTSSLILTVLLLTLAALAGAWYAIGSVNISGLLPTDFMAAQVINQRHPVHLVRPEWVAGKDQTDILLNWPVVEIKARLAFLLVVWLLGVGGLVRLSARSQRHEHSA